ncbi:MAG: NADH-quinone oxidoreductase subunit D [Planctomycetes bacterium]|nr:NADH-quinone oxidoreductase subunit D [Planctomycetota bacterium]
MSEKLKLDNRSTSIVKDAASHMAEVVVGEEMLINMGPQHPSTHGVLNKVLKTDGEIISEVFPQIGYLHRGLEKIAEKLNYHQFMPYTDRIDYLAAMNCNLAYAMAIEKLAAIEVPKRAEYIRVIMAELNRIATHLVFMGTMGLETGAWTPIVYGFREREEILDLFEMTCGQRLTYNYMRIGGVSDDLPNGFVDKARKFCDVLEKKLVEYNNLLSYNQIFIDRMAKVGVLPADLAVDYGVTGPALRGSGVKWDLRKNEPYSVYPELEFDIPVGKGELGKVGDAWDRYMVRMREIEQSIRIVRQALDKLPAGDVRAKVGRIFKPAQGEVYVRAENPRGELGFYVVSDGSANPYRLKIRTGSFNNLSAVPPISKGMMISDFVITLGSFDVVLPEIDR